MFARAHSTPRIGSDLIQLDNFRDFVCFRATDAILTLRWAVWQPPVDAQPGQLCCAQENGTGAAFSIRVPPRNIEGTLTFGLDNFVIVILPSNQTAGSENAPLVTEEALNVERDEVPQSPSRRTLAPSTKSSAATPSPHTHTHHTHKNTHYHYCTTTNTPPPHHLVTTTTTQHPHYHHHHPRTTTTTTTNATTTTTTHHHHQAPPPPSNTAATTTTTTTTTTAGGAACSPFWS